METVHVKFHWEKPICEDNSGHNCSEWGSKKENE